MSQDKSNKLHQTPQTSTDMPKQESVLDDPNISTANNSVVDTTDNNEPPMPPKEPIPSSAGWSLWKYLDHQVPILALAYQSTSEVFDAACWICLGS